MTHLVRSGCRAWERLRSDWLLCVQVRQALAARILIQPPLLFLIRGQLHRATLQLDRLSAHKFTKRAVRKPEMTGKPVFRPE